MGAKICPSFFAYGNEKPKWNFIAITVTLSVSKESNNTTKTTPMEVILLFVIISVFVLNES